MVVEHVETSNRVKKLINKLDKEEHIDEMTKRWLSLTLNPPRIPSNLHLYKYSQTNPSWETDHNGLRRPHRKNLIMC